MNKKTEGKRKVLREKIRIHNKVQEPTKKQKSRILRRGKDRHVEIRRMAADVHDGGRPDGGKEWTRKKSSSNPKNERLHNHHGGTQLTKLVATTQTKRIVNRGILQLVYREARKQCKKRRKTK